MTTMRKKTSKRVFIINKGTHDFSAAKQFGSLVYLSSGPLNRFATDRMKEIFEEGLKHSDPEDYLLITSLSVANSIASAIFARKHGRLNLLIYRVDGERASYVDRVIYFGERNEENTKAPNRADLQRDRLSANHLQHDSTAIRDKGRDGNRNI